MREVSQLNRVCLFTLMQVYSSAFIGGRFKPQNSPPPPIPPPPSLPPTISTPHISEKLCKLCNYIAEHETGFCLPHGF
jgi:hypothetical protein